MVFIWDFVCTVFTPSESLGVDDATEPLRAGFAFACEA
jgi:hypothetical protein